MTKKFLTISAAFFTSVATGISLFAGILPGADAVETVIAAEGDISMTEGDVIAGFAPEETACESSDPSVAWVDPEGKLNALKEGTASINVPGEGTYTVNVSDYTDGSEVVGKLKLLARYNDSMQFYDGHVYLLFTSYQDGVEISVPDLYGKYDISDQYYTDIKTDISNGSNHTGSDTDKYFTFTNGSGNMTLDRGEIVTIGMYRGFDLSIYEAALGSVTNSTLWKGLSDSAKSAVMDIILQLINGKDISKEELLERLNEIFEGKDYDYNLLLDGTVEGGVCFNRELYNQKLEWDQYENVTYEMDITRNQLDRMVYALGGNNGYFSILRNSCATVALRAWNAAVGRRDGADTAYKLNPVGEGIYYIMDAPKSVRDQIRSRLPGYYLNNSAGVAEPDAGFTDHTGAVYVSAPEPVSPLKYIYTDESVTIDETKTDMTTLLTAARSGEKVVYDRGEQVVYVDVHNTETADSSIVEKVDFTINSQVFSLNKDNMPDSGIWLKVNITDPEAGEEYYVTDASGKVLPSEYSDGVLGFYTESLPVTYKIVGSKTGTQNILKTVIENGDKLKGKTEVYYKKDGEKINVGSRTEVASGTDIYIKSGINSEENDYILKDITFNGVSVSGSFDGNEGAYVVTMPENYSTLKIDYQPAVVYAKNGNLIQIPAGDTINVEDYAECIIAEDKNSLAPVRWRIISDEDSVTELTEDPGQLKALKPGKAVLWAEAEGNSNIGVPFTLEVHDKNLEMVKVSYTTQDNKNFVITYREPGDSEEKTIPVSGYYVKKGSVLTITPEQTEKCVVSDIKCNSTKLKPGATFTADTDTTVDVSFKTASVVNVPGTISLSEKGDSYQMQAKVRYDDLLSRLIPVYDSSIRYVSSDPLVEVDETGLIRVAGDVSEGGKVVTVTAYAGSSNDTVLSNCRVVVGDYQGSRIVGKLTIYARPVTTGNLIPHACVTFTTYEDVDLDVSYYEYNRPNVKFYDLMHDYDLNPDKYSSDPALYYEGLGPVDRKTYFDILINGVESEPGKIKIKKGESISVSNSGVQMTTELAIKILENGTISSSKSAQELIKQLKTLVDGGEMDGAVAFDSLVATLMEAYAITKATGHNPIDGRNDGGLKVNTEAINQFTDYASQMPNNYYEVEITADELEGFKAYLSDTENNYYSVFNKNCASATIDAWNAALFDKPELHVKGNYTGFVAEPQSLYIELGLLGLHKEYDGEGGTNFYPRIVPRGFNYDHADRITPPKANSLVYNGRSQELVTSGSVVEGTMYYALGVDKENPPADDIYTTTVPEMANAGTYFVWYKAKDSTGNDMGDPDNVKVIIEKAVAPGLTDDQKPMAVEGLTENGSDQALIIAPSSLPEGYKGIMYSIDSGDSWINEIPTGNAAGSYTLLVKYAGDENHEDFFGETLTVVIQSSEDEDKDKGDQEDQKDDENDNNNNNNNNSSDSGNNDKSNDNKTTDGSTAGNKSKASSETRSAQTGDSGVTLPVVLALAAASALGLSLHVVKKRNTKNS